MELALLLLHAALGARSGRAVIESTRTMIESREFIGRRSVHNGLLPPGQYLTTDLPVLPADPESSCAARATGVDDK
jgi:hypothetical protein